MELLPCPFCGSPAKAITSDIVGCGGDQKCAVGHYLVQAAKWNTRAPSPSVAGEARAAVVEECIREVRKLGIADSGTVCAVLRSLAAQAARSET